jgi:hypothetical protein
VQGDQRKIESRILSLVLICVACLNHPEGLNARDTERRERRRSLFVFSSGIPSQPKKSLDGQKQP